MRKETDTGKMIMNISGYQGYKTENEKKKTKLKYNSTGDGC